MRSQKTVEDLKKLGCVENKSLILTFPTEQQVPKEFVYDFIRGYFDGDGSITNCNGNYNLNFVGTKSFITTLSQYFEGGSIILCAFSKKFDLITFSLTEKVKLSNSIPDCKGTYFKIFGRAGSLALELYEVIYWGDSIS